MVPVKEAISTGAWLQCECTYVNKLTQFRLKVLSFRKVDLSEIDEPEELKFDRSAQLWLMAIEVINVTKSSINTGSVSTIVLVDQDGFKFDCVDDLHLWCYSKFSQKSGLHRFFGKELSPKIKTVGAIAFQLPDDNEAIYSISIQDGTVKEA